MKLKELLSVLPFYQCSADIEDIKIAGINMDSRAVEAGDLFICINGFTVDGHDFVPQAEKQRAGAILAEKELDVSVPVIIVPDTSRAMAMIASHFYGYPTEQFPLIGVTGTNGKTTVTYLLEAIFNQHQKKTGVIGTIHMKIGGMAYPVNNTTPDSLFLQKTFKDMADAGVQTGIMEVSSHALDLGRVYGCDFDIAIFTNLTQDHLDYHKDMDDYLRAKSLLFAQLGNVYDRKKRKFAVINADDPHSDILKKSTAQHLLTYGCHDNAMVRAEAVQLHVTHTDFTLVSPEEGTISIRSRLIGMFNVYNMLAAASAAIASDVPLETIKQALETMTGVDGRFEQVTCGQSFAAIVDYAHTPDSLENVLQTIKEFARKNVYVVVGCGGDRDKTKRPLMAETALQYADKAFFTSDNPRTEDPMAILDDMVRDLKGTHYEVIENRKDAIGRAVQLAEKDDIILIAGKGHETYQQIGHTKYDFDDSKVAEEAINSKGI
jgi:UDP-N-acetylmuramoyl-L-alanyl-D-glutamate--2,6-diaminopimelate ligase